MEANWPWIYEVWDTQANARRGTLVAKTLDEAHAYMIAIYGKNQPIVLRETGKRKPPGKCCDKCKEHPCS